MQHGLVMAVLVLGIGAGGYAAAQSVPGLEPESEEAAAAVDQTSIEAIDQRHRAVLLELEELEASRVEQADEAHANDAQERLRRLASLLDAELELARDLLAAAPADGAAPLELALPASLPPSPFGLNELYTLRDDVERTSRKHKELLGVRRDALTRARETLDEAERRRRQARSEWQAAEGEAKRKKLRALELRKLAARVAQEEVHLESLALKLAQRAQEAGPSGEEIDARIAAMREELEGGRVESSAGFDALVQREGELKRLRESAERSLETAELRLKAAQNRFSREVSPSAALLEEVEALTVRRDAIRQEIGLMDIRLERLEAQRLVWQRWDAMLRGATSTEELESWETAALDHKDALTREKLQREGRASDLNNRLEAVQRRLAEPLGGERLLAALADKQETLRRLHAAQVAEIAALVSELQLIDHYVAEIHLHTGYLDLLDSLADGMQAASDVWAYEITAIDDAPITVGSLVLALLFFALGLWASRRGSMIVGRFAEQRLKLDAGATHALQTIAFYLLLVSFTLLALRAIHFPLTAFTVLGGALAIGIGFGSQNVMNNFISGLILMLERPVRARDVVEVDGNHGTIEQIGARSTQIRSTDGRHIIVPNSFFLESNVVNWTLSDELIRAKVTVGVIYGSPVRLVEELLQRVVEEDEQVLPFPKPLVIFEDFGDNSLNFDTYFWVRARSPMDMRRVQSRVRFRIDELFREQDLVIAFPQRDVHLDAVEPIEVRVLGESRSRSSGDSEDETRGGE